MAKAVAPDRAIEIVAAGSGDWFSHPARPGDRYRIDRRAQRTRGLT